MGIGEKTLRSLHVRKHGIHENGMLSSLPAATKPYSQKTVVEPTAADRELLVRVLTSGSRNGAPSTGDYRMFDTYITYLCDRLLSGCEDKRLDKHSLKIRAQTFRLKDFPFRQNKRENENHANRPRGLACFHTKQSNHSYLTSPSEVKVGACRRSGAPM